MRCVNLQGTHNGDTPLEFSELMGLYFTSI